MALSLPPHSRAPLASLLPTPRHDRSQSSTVRPSFSVLPWRAAWGIWWSLRRTSNQQMKDWDFPIGKKFQLEVLAKFKSSVHHPSSSPQGSFFLLAAFHRYTFRLTEDSVNLALHACSGGAPGFHVAHKKDCHFRFLVSSKHVGFLVCSLKKIITKHFDVYFHLL